MLAISLPAAPDPEFLLREFESAYLQTCQRGELAVRDAAMKAGLTRLDRRNYEMVQLNVV